MYTTKKVKASKTPKLDILASEAGRAYSKVVSLMRKVKRTNRNYHCNHCGFAYHRDGVGAINLYNKVSGFILSPVVGVMVSPIGVRFHPHLCKHAS